MLGHQQHRRVVHQVVVGQGWIVDPVPLVVPQQGQLGLPAAQRVDQSGEPAAEHGQLHSGMPRLELLDDQRQQRGADRREGADGQHAGTQSLYLGEFSVGGLQLDQDALGVAHHGASGLGQHHTPGMPLE